MMNPYEPPKSFEIDVQREIEDQDEVDRIDTLEFVQSALQMVQAITETRGVHVSGIEVCQMILQLAFDLNNSNPQRTIDFLTHLNLKRSEDVGDAIYELLELGYIRKSESDSHTDFDSVFDVAIPSSMWKCCWSDAE